MTLTKAQLLRNSAWTFTELTLYPLLVIAATPVFINRLGIEQYGLWMLVNTITQCINVFNIGLGDSTIRLISKYRAGNQAERIHKVFGHNFSLSLLLLLLAVVVAFLFKTFGVVSVFYKAGDHTFANNILFLAIISMGTRFVEITVLSVFKAFERFDLNAKLSILSKNSVIIGSLLMVLTGYSLVSVFALTIALNVLNIGVQLLALNRFHKGLISLPGPGFFKEKPGYIQYNFWYWLQSSIALLGFLTDKLAVAWFTDIKTLGYYSIASMVGTNIHNFFLAFGGFIFPRVSYKLASNTDVGPLYYAARSLIALPGWLLTAFLIFGGDFLFRLWLGESTYLSSIHFIKLYLVFEAGMLLIIVPFYFINGTPYLRLNSLFEIVIRASHFGAMLVGYYLAGINGILYGLILSTLLNIPFQYYVFHKKVLGLRPGLEPFAVILPLLFLLGALISESIIFKLPLMIAFIISAKTVYFDRIRQYSKDVFFQ